MTFPEIPIPTTFSHSQTKFAEEALMEDIYRAMDKLEQRLRALDLTISELQNREAIEKYAHLKAFNEVQDLAWNFLKTKIDTATEKTVEYNIALFTTRMDEALYQHKNDLIQLRGDSPGNISVILNLELLGSPEQYTSAVNEARASLGIGKIPDPEIRSHIWAEKIYGTEREGRKIIHPKTGEDITERYIGLYTQTIVERLSVLDPSIAPWWYYINYGNIDLTEGDEGTPYPVIEPTYFSSEIIFAIEDAFYSLYNDLLLEAEEIYKELLEKDFGIEGITPFVQDILDSLDKLTLQQILNLSNEITGQQTIITVNYNDTAWDLYVTSIGKIGARFNLQQNR
jgi:hypothetical protein